jgi:hypothetical protein
MYATNVIIYALNCFPRHVFLYLICYKFYRFANLENQDIWLAIQLYFADANAVDSKLLHYHAFSRQQLRRLQELSQSMTELLRTTLKVFADDQSAAWEEAAMALSTLGARRTALTLQTLPGAAGGAGAASVPTPVSVLFPAADGDEGSGSSTSNAAGAAGGGGCGKATDPLSGALSVVTLEGGDSGKGNSGRGTNGGGDYDGLGAGIDDSSPAHTNRTNASVFRADFFGRLPADAYVAYHGRLSYCATTRAEAHAGIDFTEHSLWHEVMVLMTYDRVLHVMQMPHARHVHSTGNCSPTVAVVNDALAFDRDGMILSVNVRNVEVRPFTIPKEGYRDAFEILLAGANSKKMSILGNLAASSKDVTALVFVAEDTFQMQSWVRAITHPFADPSVDPPESLHAVSVTATGGGGAMSGSGSEDIGGSPGGRRASASNAGGLSGSSGSGALGSDVDAHYGVSGGGGGAGEVVMGSNSLRDLKRTLSGMPGTPAATTANPTLGPAAAANNASSLAFSDSSSSSGAAGGSDVVSGTNMLRTLKKVPSSAANTSGASASASASVGGNGEPEIVSGTNALRSLKKIPSAQSNSIGGTGSAPSTPIASSSGPVSSLSVSSPNAGTAPAPLPLPLPSASPAPPSPAAIASAGGTGGGTPPPSIMQDFRMDSFSGANALRTPRKGPGGSTPLGSRSRSVSPTPKGASSSTTTSTSTAAAPAPAAAADAAESSAEAGDYDMYPSAD